MIFLHCGWPRTGTSALQATAAEFSSQLAAADFTYPDGWKTPELRTPAHHGLEAVLHQLAGGEDPIEFRAFLEDLDTQNLLLSSEVLTNWLPNSRRTEFFGLIEAAQESMPVTCLLTLRRADEFFSSMYTQSLLLRSLPDPDEFFSARINWVAELIEGMTALIERSETAVKFVRYGSDGSHQGTLLEAIGVSHALREQMVERIRTMPRVGVRLTRKPLTSLKYLDEIETRTGCSLERRRLARVYWAGELTFENDGPCVLGSPKARGAAHQRALHASRDAGFEPYLDYFGADEVSDHEETALHPDLLDDRDLELIVAAAATPEPATAR